MPYGFGRQLPIIPPSLNDLNLPPNPFNILATMAKAYDTEDANDNNYRPESLEIEKKIEPRNVLSKRWGSVAERLRSLRTDDPSSKGHPRSIKQELET